MKNKKFLAHIFLKNAKAVRDFRDDRLFEGGDAVRIAQEYEKKGADGLILFDLSQSEDEHEQNIGRIREIGRETHIPLIGGGHIKRAEDVKKLIYAGCSVVFLNMSKEENVRLLGDVSKRFGKDKLAVCISQLTTLASNLNDMSKYASFALLFGDNRHVYEAVARMQLPTIPFFSGIDHERLEALLRHDNVAGISGKTISDPEMNLTDLRESMAQRGIAVRCFDSEYSWDDLRKNSDGLVPVIVQDFYNQEVLMMAYMNEEAYHHTLLTGKMTYYSRSRQKLWVKGETSGHFQLVRQILIDCDNDTLLARVAQIGAACHTGHRSCFYRSVAVLQADQKKRDSVFEDVMKVILERKHHPKEGSYTNYLFDHGIDKILKKLGEESTEIVIAAKNENPEEIKYEIGDFLYHMMVLMAQCGITWDDITEELAKR